VSPQSFGIAFLERCFDAAKLIAIEWRAQNFSLKHQNFSLKHNVSAVRLTNLIWTRCATFGNKAAKLGTSFGRK
jgi:hypothetical protein